MDILTLILVVIFWLPAGYLGSRILSAFNGEISFNWSSPGIDRKIFGLGVLMGMVTLILAMIQIFLFLFLLAVNFSMDAIIFCIEIFVNSFAHRLEKPITFLGRLAPRK